MSLEWFRDEDVQRHWREAIARNHEEHARYVREGHGGHIVRQLGAMEKLELELERLTETLRGEADT